MLQDDILNNYLTWTGLLMFESFEMIARQRWRSGFLRPHPCKLELQILLCSPFPILLVIRLDLYMFQNHL